MSDNSSSPKLDFPPPPSGSYPTPQGYNSPTFHPPPVDGTLCLPELFEYHATHSREHPLFVYADGTSQVIDSHNDQVGTETKPLKYPQAWRMIQRAARIVKGHYTRLEEMYTRQIREPGVNSVQQKVPPTIGILANAGEMPCPDVHRLRRLILCFSSVLGRPGAAGDRFDQLLLHHPWHHASRSHPVPTVYS